MAPREEKAPLLHNGSQNDLAYGSFKHDTEEPPAPPPKFLCTKRDIIVVIIALSLAFITIIVTLSLGIPKIQERQKQYEDTTFFISSSPLKSFKHAAVVTDAEPCAAIGRNVLYMNGSAVDAAIASLFCDGVINAQSMGLGGGFLMVVYTKETGKSEFINAREVAPAAATRDMFGGNATVAQESGLAIAVPGELKGYWAAHQKYGQMNWSLLIEPTIKICENGFNVSRHMASKLEMLKDKILSNENMRHIFYNNKTEDLYKEGELLKRPDLANTLKKIAASDGDILYTGALSEDFLKDIKSCGGIITKEDLKSYKPKFQDAATSQLKKESENITLHTAPLPGGGHIVSLILRVLNGYNFNSEDMVHVNQAVLSYHRMVEAFKFGFALRGKLADPDFVDTKELIDKIMSDKYVDVIHNLISDEQTFPPQYYLMNGVSNTDHGTAHVSVLAPNGDAVSVTSTINTHFGSLCLSPLTGIILNNNMDDFSSPNITNYFGTPPSHANFIEPGKQPLSSMSPSILVDEKGEPKIVIGAVGGPHIITALAQTLMRILWLDADLKQAIDAPRLHHQLYPNYIQHEALFPKIYLDKLQKYGHEVEADPGGSSVFCISRDQDKVEANYDYRKGGSADGF